MQPSKIHVQKLHTLKGHRDSVYSLAQGKEPWEFYSAGGDGYIVKWDLRQPETGSLVAKLDASVYAMHFDAEKNELIVGQNYEGIHVIDMDQKKVKGSLKLTSAAIFDIQRGVDELYVATGDGVLIVVDLKQMAVRKHVKAGSDRARSIAIDELKKVISVGYSDHHIRQFDMDEFRLLQEWKAHENSVFHIKHPYPGGPLLSVSRDARLKVWNLENTPTPTNTIVAHMYAINHFDFSPDGKLFVTCSMDKSIKVWDADTFRLLKVIDKARHASHGTSVNRVLWSPYQDQMIAASDDRTLTVWHIEKSDI
jgi:WD40 repeat protein